ncbi:MAG: type IV pilus modification protein PilV [Gammaproteobacteria bacterium]|nr:type IV pilus modification protein PilV [Gammaproteobacteria bacterium]
MIIHCNNHSQGFTLLEVMIALVIFSIGLIGLAGLQSLSLQNNQVAYARTMATILAYDMADRIHNNRIGAASGSYAVTTMPASATSCITSSCTPAVLATYDLYQWDQTVRHTQNNPAAQNELFNALGYITRNGSVYSIYIAWDEARNGTATSSGICAAPPAGVSCVRLDVVP